MKIETKIIPTHTPTPWAEEDIAGMLRHEVTDADFTFIVRAVNAHEELISIVRKLQECFETGVDKAVIYASGFSDLNANNPDETWQEAIERIAKAEGK